MRVSADPEGGVLEVLADVVHLFGGAVCDPGAGTSSQSRHASRPGCGPAAQLRRAASALQVISEFADLGTDELGQSMR